MKQYQNKPAIVRFLSLLLSVFLLLGMALLCSLEEIRAKSKQIQPALEDVSIRLNYLETAENTSFWYDNSAGVYYVFLPSAAQGEIYFSTPGFRSLVIGNEEISNDTPYIPPIYGQPLATAFYGVGDRLLEKSTVVFMRGSELPAMHIDTLSGSLDAIHADKNYSESGSMRLVDTSGSALYNGRVSSVGGRGNYTWTLGKKSYNIVLSDSANLLGMGQDTKWALIANMEDPSNIRNYIAYKLADDSGLAFASQARFVELYINGDYCGLYQLTTPVKIADNRIDIGDLEAQNDAVSPKPDRGYTFFEDGDGAGSRKGVELNNVPQDITGGYLLEFDTVSRYTEEPSGFVTERGRHVVVKSPQYADRAEVDYIANFVDGFERALNSSNGADPVTGKRWNEFIDVDSWVRRYLHNEITKPQDRFTSQYFYKPAGEDSVLYAGPVWDYDFSMGNSAVPRTDEIFALTDMWIRLLWNHDEFRQAVYDEYVENFRPLMQQIANSSSLPALQTLSASAAMDNARNGTERHFISGDLNVGQNNEQLSAYFGGRIETLDRVFIDKEPIYVLEFEGIEPVFMLIEGQVYMDHSVPNPPNTDSEALERFMGWYIRGTDRIFNPEQPIMQDTILYPQFAPAKDNGVKKNAEPENRGDIQEFMPVIITGAVFLFAFAMLVISDIRRNKTVMVKKQGSIIK